MGLSIPLKPIPSPFNSEAHQELAKILLLGGSASCRADMVRKGKYHLDAAVSCPYHDCIHPIAILWRGYPYLDESLFLRLQYGFHANWTVRRRLAHETKPENRRLLACFGV